MVVVSLICVQFDSSVADLMLGRCFGISFEKKRASPIQQGARGHASTIVPSLNPFLIYYRALEAMVKFSEIRAKRERLVYLYSFLLDLLLEVVSVLIFT